MNQISEELSVDSAREMIHENTESGFSIFLENQKHIVWKTRPPYSEILHKDLEKHQKVTYESALLLADKRTHLDSNEENSFLRLIGAALSCSFAHDYVSAFFLLGEAKAMLAIWQLPEHEWEEIITENMEKGFVVVIDKKFKVYWETSNLYSPGEKADLEKHNTILSEAAVLETTPKYYLSDENKQSFNRLIGEALVRSFECDYKNASLMLEKASIFLTSRKNETSRLWYITSSLVTLLVFFLIAITFDWIEGYKSHWLHDGVPGFFSILAVGMLGSVIFTAQRVSGTSFDYGSERSLYVLEGFFKVMVGGVSALVVTHAINANMLSQDLIIKTQNPSMIFLLSFIAGYSERWVPSLLTNITNTKDKKDKKDEN